MVVDEFHEKVIECFEENKEIIYSILFKLKIPSDDVDDVCQQGILSALESDQNYNPTSRLKPWLITIIRNRAIDYLRKRNRQTTYSFDDLDIFEQSKEQCDIFDTQESVRNTLSYLSLYDQSILTDLYINNLSLKEIANKNQVSIPCVKSRAYRARQKFIKHYN